MKGQLVFDEFMNITEEKMHQNTSNWRVPMVDPCYYCLCNSCIYNVENRSIKPEEYPYNWEPCFYCDECRNFNGDITKKNMEREQCSRYKIDSYHAQINRKKFRSVR